jgi:hypothetical protein
MDDDYWHVGSVGTVVGLFDKNHPCFVARVFFDNTDDFVWGMEADSIELIDAPNDPLALNDNPTIKSVILEFIDAQLAKGASKYGQGVDVNDGHSWLLEAAQEIADTWVYMAAEIARLRKHVETLEAMVNAKNGDKT